MTAGEQLPAGLMRIGAELRPRRWGPVFDFNRLTCPAGHAVRMHRNVTESGCLECATCRALLYVAVVPAFGGARWVLAVDVTAAERDQISDQGLDVRAALRALGVEFPTGARRAGAA